MEEAFWHEKAKVKWHNEGDRNTAFFHRTARIKQAYKKIASIRIDDNIITEPDIIANHVVNHFQNLFSSDNVSLDNGLIEEVIPSLITEDINKMLTLMPSLAEIQSAVFSMNKDGAPGPDGFGAFFFQTYWEILKDDVSNAMLEFFSTNRIMPNFNSNTVVLIPKVQDADTIGQYRSISMANFKFKIISKILADRLALSLPNIISQEQRGFIKGKLKLIKGTRHVTIPSHILYADDIMLFCKGTSTNINVLSSFFDRYAQISGQHINPQKSTIFAGSISHVRITSIANSLGFCIGSLPFNYLGVPIFKAKPKALYFQPIVDKVKLKLASWKASLLTYAGRIQLVKSVIHSMLVYSITTYSWPVSIIKELESYIRNFIWSGDYLVRKLVTVSWHKVCSLIDEGGLGIRSLSTLNKASNLKLFWEMMCSDNQWVILLRSRVIRGNEFIKHHIYSSIWSGLKSQEQIILQNTIWLLGDGKSINFWLHNWSGNSIVNLLQIPQNLHHHLFSKVSDFIFNKQWFVPMEVQVAFPILLPYLNQITIPLEHKEDKLLWIHSAHGDLTLKDAYFFFMNPSQKLSWAKSI
ncbi:hypothetical protein TSUD_411120 [Trifolium subterraneum]|uniref:Reverse transcriptase domain-containing protein n=1 Tax=Trifolium subterraneum TaxID=3900 RepID=A0A2Z6P7V7_TRISU|nr:hypothetical protein TSUD_411120 [Trifolium subterraneum]